MSDDVTNLSVGRDPYSDNPRDFVVWDGLLMPFDGTRRECDEYVRLIGAGVEPGEATHRARGGA